MLYGACMCIAFDLFASVALLFHIYSETLEMQHILSFISSKSKCNISFLCLNYVTMSEHLQTVHLRIEIIILMFHRVMKNISLV